MNSRSKHPALEDLGGYGVYAAVVRAVVRLHVASGRAVRFSELSEEFPHLKPLTLYTTLQDAVCEGRLRVVVMPKSSESMFAFRPNPDFIPLTNG